VLGDPFEDDYDRVFVGGSDFVDVQDVHIGDSSKSEAEASVRDNVSRPAGSGLRPYNLFDEPLASLGEGSLSTVAANVVRIVGVEGPVLGDRLQQAYIKASGGQKVGKNIARVLNQAITSAERQGHIVSDNPLNAFGIKPKTFRLPTQPRVIPRELGPRSVNLVPPAELAHHLAEMSAGDEGRTEEELFRAVLERLGLQRLTENAKTVLAGVAGLVSAEEGRDR
jgi:hypothetical protein